MIKRIAHRFIHTGYRSLQQRVQALTENSNDLNSRVLNLEKAVDILIDWPEWTPSEGIAFNSQAYRKRIFSELIARIPFYAIIETGTYVGGTAGYMANVSGLPVYTCECEKRFYSLAKRRLRSLPNVTIELKDSRGFLLELSKTDIVRRPVFFYLDAHWGTELPLRDELALIVTSWSEYVVMIDDFQVPFDGGYGFDSYGANRKLTLDLISDIIEANGLVSFFPALPSKEETGSRRGCVLLSAAKGLGLVLQHMTSVRPPIA